MTYRTAVRGMLALFAALLLSASANAQLFRSYLARTGSDSNPCTLPAPCRLLPAALAAVADGGEIWMLDSANYNSAMVTIDRSVTILAVPGVVGSVLAIGGPAIYIPTAGAKVALRNLVIVPLPGGGGTGGIYMSNGSALTVENTLFANLSGDGIVVATPAQVRIANTVLRDIAAHGIRMQNGATADISNSKLYGIGGLAIRADGYPAGTTSTVTVSDTVVSESYVGFSAISYDPTGIAQLFATRCTATNNSYGFTSQVNVAGTNNAVMTVSNSLAANNTYGFGQFGAGSVFKSTGNSAVHDNPGGDVVGLISPSTMH